jgi:cellulose synthase/poly-beta-1,6-N-acetylglucosamine synthase-like glycosyltransferase
LNPFLYTFEGYRLVLRALVALMSAQFVLGTLLFLRSSRRKRTPPAPERWPAVTVQLPLRNEFYAAERVIEAAGALDYPPELFEIQVLDDSDDRTSEVVAVSLERLRRRGIEASHIRRHDPQGHKAGALAAGLREARGELVAIFDADFVPSRDFLKKTVPYFADPAVGLVQGRWEHTNRNASWFTRLQASILDGLMVVEQTAKSDAGLPFQFNGSGGVWKKSAIERAGGWKFDSLTEDLDLSIRAQLAGIQLVHVPDVAVPSELPTTLGLFRVQQRRWALGTAQLLRKRLGSVLRSPLPFSSRLSILFQLGRHLGYPLLVLMVLTLPLTTFAYVHTPLEYGVINALVLGAAVLSVAFQHAVAQRAIGRNIAPAILFAPFSIALAIGLAPTYTVALVYGFFDRAGPFHRTPKVPRTPRAGEPTYRARRSILVAVELVIGALYAWFSYVAISRNIFTEGGFFAFVSFAYLWVGVGSLRVDAAPPSPVVVPERVPHGAPLAVLDPELPAATQSVPDG